MPCTALSAQRSPHRAERRAPVHADDIDVQRAHLLHQGRTLIGVVDQRDAQGAQRRDVRCAPRRANCRNSRRQQARPRLEQHQRLGARARLGRQVRGHGIGQMSISSVAGFGLVVEEAARDAEFLRGLAADQIAQQGERRARETDQRHAAGRVRAHQLHGIQHEGHIALRIQGRQRLHLRRRADGVAHHRTRLEGQRNAHALERRHDVAEQDRGIEREAPHGLQRHFGGQLRAAGEGDEVDARAQFAVFGQVAARLAHHPYGGMRHFRRRQALMNTDSVSSSGTESLTAPHAVSHWTGRGAK